MWGRIWLMEVAIGFVVMDESLFGGIYKIISTVTLDPIGCGAPSRGTGALQHSDDLVFRADADGGVYDLAVFHDDEHRDA